MMDFIKRWALPIAMCAGVASYYLMCALPLTSFQQGIILRGVEVVQPILIVTMLFLAFCKVSVRQLHFSKWHGWLLLFQGMLFVAFVLTAMHVHHPLLRISLETAMLCLICPTATAACVVTGKLGGDVPGLTSYIILVNLLTSILFPLFVPLISPIDGLAFSGAFLMILRKLFPVLLFPFFAAELLRVFAPKLHAWFASRSGWAFRIWTVALALAIALTTRSIVHSNMPLSIGIAIALVSMLCCIVQFYIGRRVGRRYGNKIAASQGLGQKNTILAIWMGYTFLTPISAVAGGFYSIWHNIFNAYQLSRRKGGN